MVRAGFKLSSCFLGTSPHSLDFCIIKALRLSVLRFALFCLFTIFYDTIIA
nr:MAG TPA: hypothetical protein [Caudoviricetes sp.]